MGHMGNGGTGVGHIWGHRGYGTHHNGYMGNGDTGGSGGTGVWSTWVMRPTGAKEYREYGYGVHRE